MIEEMLCDALTVDRLQLEWHRWGSVPLSERIVRVSVNRRTRVYQFSNRISWPAMDIRRFAFLLRRQFVPYHVDGWICRSFADHSAAHRKCFEAAQSWERTAKCTDHALQSTLLYSIIWVSDGTILIVARPMLWLHSKHGSVRDRINKMLETFERQRCITNGCLSVRCTFDCHLDIVLCLSWKFLIGQANWQWWRAGGRGIFLEHMGSAQWHIHWYVNGEYPNKNRMFIGISLWTHTGDFPIATIGTSDAERSLL